MFIVNKPSITDFVIEFRGERERNRKIEKERKREREKKQNCEDRRKEKRNKEVKEICTALCDYHSVCLKYNKPALFIDNYLTAIK